MNSLIPAPGSRRGGQVVLAAIGVVLWRKYKKEQDFWNFKNITTGSNAKYTPIELTRCQWRRASSTAPARPPQSQPPCSKAGHECAHHSYLF